MNRMREKRWRAGALGLLALGSVESAHAAVATVNVNVQMDWTVLDAVVDWTWDHSFNGADAQVLPRGTGAVPVEFHDYTLPDSDPAEAKVGVPGLDIAKGNASTTATAP